LITVTDLHKVYHQSGRKVRALDGVSLTVPEGSVHGIIGHSGAGKSTLVRCLAMLDRPTSGSIEIGGVELTKVHSTALRNARRSLGLVFQNANLFDSRTVWRNVTYPLEIQGRRASARARGRGHGADGVRELPRFPFRLPFSPPGGAGR